MRYLLDTHAWVWWNSKPNAVSPRVLKLIQDSKYDELLLSCISVWELSKLLEKKRLTHPGVRWDGLDQDGFGHPVFEIGGALPGDSMAVDAVASAFS